MNNFYETLVKYIKEAVYTHEHVHVFIENADTKFISDVFGRASVEFGRDSINDLLKFKSGDKLLIERIKHEINHPTYIHEVKDFRFDDVKAIKLLSLGFYNAKEVLDYQERIFIKEYADKYPSYNFIFFDEDIKIKPIVDYPGLIPDGALLRIEEFVGKYIPDNCKLFGNALIPNIKITYEHSDWRVYVGDVKIEFLVNRSFNDFGFYKDRVVNEKERKLYDLMKNDTSLIWNADQTSCSGLKLRDHKLFFTMDHKSNINRIIFPVNGGYMELANFTKTETIKKHFKNNIYNK